MSKSQEYKIPKEIVLQLLKMNESEYRELLRAVGFTSTTLNYNQIKTIYSYLSALGKASNIDKSILQETNYQEYLILEQNEHKISDNPIHPDKEIIDIPKASKVKSVKKKRKQTIKQSKKIDSNNDEFTLLQTQKEASKVFNHKSEPKRLFYAHTITTDINECKSFDLSKSFSANIKSIQSEQPKKRFYLYTNHEVYNKKSTRKVVCKKAREWTSLEDKKILEYYNSEYYKSQNKSAFENPYTMDDLCKDLKADKKTISIRASFLGFTNFKRPNEKDYSNREIEILETYKGRKTSKQIQRLLKEEGFIRSETSINIKINRMDNSRLLDGKGDLNLALLSKLMGVDTHFFTNCKERLDKLNPTFENAQYIFKRENVRKYIIENPYDFNIAKVEQKAFIELLTEAGECINEMGTK